MIRQNKWYDYAAGILLGGFLGYAVYKTVTTIFKGWFLILLDFINLI